MPLRNDDTCGKGSLEVPLSFTTCRNEEFTCKNGLCVSLSYRCDGEPDCGDASDEVDCKLIEKSSFYQQHLAPLEGHTKVSVNITIDIKAIHTINEIEGIFQVQFWLRLSWVDKRLTFFNLGNLQSSNCLTEDEKSQIWIPYLTFLNTENQDCTVLDEKTKIQIAKKGSHIFSSLDEAENIKKFSGGRNPLVMTLFYNINFICDFDMRWFPFDTQRCSLIIITQGDSGKYVELIKETLDYSGPKDMMLYFIKDQQFKKGTIKGGKAIIVEIVLGRRLFSIIMTTILPTIILLLTSYSTNFFKDFFFETVVAVNLTVMLGKGLKDLSMHSRGDKEYNRRK